MFLVEMLNPDSFLSTEILFIFPLLDMQSFLGRFHPLVVHLPIGFLFIAVALEILSRKKKYENLKHATGFVLMLTSISSIIAAILGYFLSQGEGYEEKSLSWHKWFGIALAAVSTFAWLFKMFFEKRPSRAFRIGYTSMLVIAFICLVITGHEGGSLTHGADYLTSEMPEPLREFVGLPKIEEPPPKQITNIPQAVVYADIIQPMLDKRCVSCHNPSKKKGGLVLTTKENLLKGGKNGDAIKPGKPEQSHLFTSLLLPEDDDKHMPPKGKTQLTKDQVSLIHWWIQQGADFEKKVVQLNVPDTIKRVLTKLAQANEPLKGIFAKKVNAADSATLATAREAGFIITPIAKDVNYLQVYLAQDKDTFGVKEVKALRGMSGQLAWLNLKGRTILPAALDSLKQFPNLARLHLGNTNIQDEMLRSLSGLKELEYLNLYGTGITDSGLKYLAGLKNLSALYLWQTKVTETEAGKLKAANPAMQISFGSQNLK
jgi:uncharacterized membrane protein/mono/diheme cytochrome c family protein